MQYVRASEGRGLNEEQRVLVRAVEGESDFLLSGDEAEEGQTLEREGESSEDDIPAFKEPAQGQTDNARHSL